MTRGHVAWEVLYLNFMFVPDSLDKYADYVVEKLRAFGASERQSTHGPADDESQALVRWRRFRYVEER